MKPYLKDLQLTWDNGSLKVSYQFEINPEDDVKVLISCVDSDKIKFLSEANCVREKLLKQYENVEGDIIDSASVKVCHSHLEAYTTQDVYFKVKFTAVNSGSTSQERFISLKKEHLKQC